jgi:hypothetical protein
MMIDPAPSSSRVASASVQRRRPDWPGGIGDRHTRCEVGDLLAHRDASNTELTARAVVALHEHADGVATGFSIEHARRGADATLESMAYHAGATTNVSLRDPATGGAIQRGDGMRGCHVKAVDVVESAVVGLGDNRQPPGLQPWTRDLPLKDGIAYDADAVRIGNPDRPFEQPALSKPGGARHLAVAVEREPRAEHRVVTRLAAWMDNGDAGADRPLSHLEPSLTGNERRVPHFNAGDVGDRVEYPGRAADDFTQSELAGARFRW